MRSVGIVLILALCVTMTAFSQVATTGVAQALPSFAGNNIVDPHGNLLVFDTLYSLSAVPLSGGGTTVMPTGVTTLPIRNVTPTTRITVIPGGTGQPLVKQYAASFQVVGAGKSAVYAVIYPAAGVRKLIAIDAGTGGNLLPADLSGFLSMDLTLSGDIKLYPATLGSIDTLTSVDPATFAVLLTPTATATPVRTVARIARTIKFDGIRFSTTDVLIPQ